MPKPLWHTLAAFVFLASPASAADTLPLTHLTPAKPTPDACVYRYPVATRSAECQAFCDQAFGYYYSYVWIEAARSFETALRYDPECAQAWLGLHMAIVKWGKSKSPKPAALAALGGAFEAKLPGSLARPPADYALAQAQALVGKAGDRGKLLIRAKLQEKGLWPDTPPDERKKKATATLDELLMLYDDDQEGWFARAQIAEGPNGAIPFYKAVLRVNPLHPGANHELVHFYEGTKRPALGWPFAEKYIASSPGIPHAFHMQAHLATRIGKWARTTDWSSRAIELQRAYHKDQGVPPADDHQFFHHLEILTKSLLHDGRVNEATKIKGVAEAEKYSMEADWFRLALLAEDWPAAEAIVAKQRKSHKFNGAYYGAQLALARNDLPRAKAELDTMLHSSASTKGRAAKQNQGRQWEIQGRVLSRTGQGEAGAKLLQRAVDKTKDDFTAHSWGGGAYFMEVRGQSALDAGLAAEAEEGFLEALAHDSGSVRGALGLWALCSRLDRHDEAAGYMRIAQKAWARADAGLFDRLRSDFVHAAEALPLPKRTTSTSLKPTTNRPGDSK
jgi:hypothetical protein